MGIGERLEGIRALRAKTRRLESKIEYCKEQSMKIPGPVWGEEKPHSQPSGKAPFEKWVLKRLDLERELKEVQDEMDEKKIALTEAISSIVKEENVLKVVLLRELSFLGYEKIAEKLGISRSYVYRLHKTGLDELGIGRKEM